MIPHVQHYVHDEPDYFYVFVNVGPHRIGEMLVNKVDEGRARLGNIDVKKKWKRARPWSERLLSFNFSSHEFVNFQGKGIGSELLDRLRSWCSRNGITEVFGSVTTDDLEKTPGLLEWYAERGFATHPPSEESLEGSVAMVVWKASPNQEPPSR
jgi:GNAT superfamily N-acetyltransferase